MPLTPEEKARRTEKALPLPTHEDIKAFVQAAAVSNIPSMQLYLDLFGRECVDEVHNVTALMQAVLFCQMDSVNFLLRHGADVNCRDIHGMTAAMYATFTDDGPSLKILLNHGAELEAVTEQGMTILMMAAWQNAGECVTLLLERGADTRATDKEGLDVTERALCNDNYSIVEQIEAHHKKIAHAVRKDNMRSIRSIFSKGTQQVKKPAPIRRMPKRPPPKH